MGPGLSRGGCAGDPPAQGAGVDAGAGRGRSVQVCSGDLGQSGEGDYRRVHATGWGRRLSHGPSVCGLHSMTEGAGEGKKERRGCGWKRRGCGWREQKVKISERQGGQRSAEAKQGARAGSGRRARAVLRPPGGARGGPRPAPPPAHPRLRRRAASPGMLLPLLRSSCFPSSSPGGGSGGGGADAGGRPAAQLQRGARGPPGPLERALAQPGAEPRRLAEAEGARGLGGPHACMDPGAALHRRPAGGGGLGAGSPALSGGQARRRKQPPRPADFKLQVIIIGSRGVGKTSLMERFTDDTFCEACKSTVGKAGQGRPRGAPASPDRTEPPPRPSRGRGCTGPVRPGTV